MTSVTKRSGPLWQTWSPGWPVAGHQVFGDVAELDRIGVLDADALFGVERRWLLALGAC